MTESAGSNIAVQVKDVRVQFGDYRALDGITFDIEEKGFLTVLGPNGSGKSTLLRTLLGLVRPSLGYVRLFGQPPDRIRPEDIAYIPQVKTLDRSFPALSKELVLTGLNRRWPGRRRDSDLQLVLSALDRVGASHLADRPLGILSGGELQRVYLARGIVREPSLIVLDEPATGIDKAGMSNVYDELAGCQRDFGATVVMVTHDWDVAMHHASHVLLLNGTQVSFGHPEVALTEKAVRTAYAHVGHAHAMTVGGKAS